VEPAHLRYVEGQTEVVSSTIPAHRLIHMCRCILEHSSADIPQMQYTSFDILYTAFTNMLCVVLHIYLCLFTTTVAIQLHVSFYLCLFSFVLLKSLETSIAQFDSSKYTNLYIYFSAALLNICCAYCIHCSSMVTVRL